MNIKNRPNLIILASLFVYSSILCMKATDSAVNATHSEAHLSCNDIVVDIHHDTYGTMGAALPQLTSLPSLPDEEPADIESNLPPKSNIKRTVASHSLVGILSAAISAGVLLAIHFTQCKN